MPPFEKAIRVLLAEDHVTVRQGLKLLIDDEHDMTVVGEAADGAGALEGVQAAGPDVVVMDLSMPGMNGLLATRAIKVRHPQIAVVALTRHDDEAYLQELLRAGASGYVLKQSASAELLEAIRAAAAGRQHLDSALRAGRRFPFRHAAQPEARPVITEREADVLRQIAKGYSNKEIAAELDISVKTVEVHKANGTRKLGLRGRIDIVRYALMQGWLVDE
jgi:DNA-binding NarL/FixJ family response regulator